MPFYFDDFDPRDYAEDPDAYVPGHDDHVPTHRYVYQPPQATTFEPGRDAYAALAFESLVAIGATHVRVRYDGGGDEGYAHVAAVRFADGERPAAEVVAQLADDREFEARARATRPAVGPSWLEDATGAALAEGMLAALAYEIAAAVAGDGFGVEVSSIYGVATADLETLEVAEDLTAPPPEREA